MKKMCTLLASVLMASTINAQTPFFEPTKYIGAFPVTDGTAATDWTSGWANFDPENVVYGAATLQVTANITVNTTWSASTVYQLVGNIAVTNGAVLTIPAGTVIRGDKASKSCLIITKGSKIVAQGTAASPIVFTSNEAVGARSMGDWGGIIILGNGIINSAGTNPPCTGCGTNPNISKIEGFAAYDDVQLYGGNNNADSSGVLSYVRIEFSGVALSGTANSEINGLTLGGVGSKTKIDHVQVSFNGDDSFEWFGGAVNCKYLIAYRTFDDDFDTDFGYDGNVQFGLIVRDPDEADASKTESFESDNYNPGIGRMPVTNAIFSNVTVVGPKRDGTVSLFDADYLCAAQLRRNTAISIFNTIITGWPKGLQVEGSATQDNFSASNDSLAVFGNNWIIGATNSCVTGTNAPYSFYQAFFGSNSNDSLKTNGNVAWVDAFPANLETKPDFRLQTASLAKNAGSFGHTKFTGLLLDTTNVDTIPLAVRNNNKTIEYINLYPNPAAGNVSVNLSLNQASSVTIELFDITGRKVVGISKTNYLSGKHQVSLNTSNLSKGIYQVRVLTENEVKTLKLSFIK